jgi:hypothetical protein
MKFAALRDERRRLEATKGPLAVLPQQDLAQLFDDLQVSRRFTLKDLGLTHTHALVVADFRVFLGGSYPFSNVRGPIRA